MAARVVLLFLGMCGRRILQHRFVLGVLSAMFLACAVEPMSPAGAETQFGNATDQRADDDGAGDDAATDDGPGSHGPSGDALGGHGVTEWLLGDYVEAETYTRWAVHSYVPARNAPIWSAMRLSLLPGGRYVSANPDGAAERGDFVVGPASVANERAGELRFEITFRPAGGVASRTYAGRLIGARATWPANDGRRLSLTSAAGELQYAAQHYEIYCMSKDDCEGRARPLARGAERECMRDVGSFGRCRLATPTFLSCRSDDSCAPGVPCYRELDVPASNGICTITCRSHAQCRNPTINHYGWSAECDRGRCVSTEGRGE